MLVISSREFRQNQSMYFELVDNKEQVIVQRGKNKAYKILPVESDDVCMSEKEFYDKLDKSILEAKEGNISILTKEKQRELLGL